MSRRLWTVVVGGVLVLVAGCGNEVGPPAPAWDQPAAYTYTLTSSCGERLAHGKMRLSVAGGKVVKAEGLDEPGRTTVSVAKVENLPTIKDLIEEYETARRQGADVATAEFGEGGRPTRIDLDIQRNSVDDEACYEVSDFSAG